MALSKYQISRPFTAWKSEITKLNHISTMYHSAPQKASNVMVELLARNYAKSVESMLAAFPTKEFETDDEYTWDVVASTRRNIPLIEARKITGEVVGPTATAGENGEEFFRVIRDAHPDVPVIFIEDVIFPHTAYDNRIKEEVMLKNQAQKRLFARLKKSGEKKIYYIGAEGMIGDDGEATVDGIHFTDLGMMRYVDHVLPTIKKALRK
jgi:hypothetical protein